MAYYAQIKDGVVFNIVVADDPAILPIGTWVETTTENQAYIGKEYIESLNKFVGPQPFASWQLDSSYNWIPPKECPVQGWLWIEDISDWVDPATLVPPTSNQEVPTETL